MAERTEWGIERLDLGGYVDRIGYPGSLRPSAATLRGLHRAHITSISFENLDVVLGRGIDLDLSVIQDKLVRRPRGGYCHEHNLLFAAALERLGFRVTRLLARPLTSAHPLPRGHCSLLVRAEGRTWLADVGYGGQGPLEPIPLEDGVRVSQGGWLFRLDRDGSEWTLATAGPEGWVSLYAVTPFAYRQPDFEMANYFVSTHPSSPFATDVIVQRNTDSARYALRGVANRAASGGLDLTLDRPDGSRQRQRVDPRGLPHVLRQIFGILLPEDDAQRLALIHSHPSTGSARRPEKAA